METNFDLSPYNVDRIYLLDDSTINVDIANYGNYTCLDGESFPINEDYRLITYYFSPENKGDKYIGYRIKIFYDDKEMVKLEEEYGEKFNKGEKIPHTIRSLILEAHVQKLYYSIQKDDKCNKDEIVYKIDEINTDIKIYKETIDVEVGFYIEDITVFVDNKWISDILKSLGMKEW